jgi:hypothetical protein
MGMVFKLFIRAAADLMRLVVQRWNAQPLLLTCVFPVSHESTMCTVVRNPLISQLEDLEIWPPLNPNS